MRGDGRFEQTAETAGLDERREELGLRASGEPAGDQADHRAPRASLVDLEQRIQMMRDREIGLSSSARWKHDSARARF